MTRDQALAELRRLTRVDVLAVHRSSGDEGYRGCHPTRPEHRVPTPPMWWLTVERTWGGELRRVAVSIGPSGSVRNPKRLNAWTRSLGRSASLPPLNAEDGREVIKLLHAINEGTNDDAR